jgi:hypothetical protein
MIASEDAHAHYGDSNRIVRPRTLRSQKKFSMAGCRKEIVIAFARKSISIAARMSLAGEEVPSISPRFETNADACGRAALQSRVIRLNIGCASALVSRSLKSKAENGKPKAPNRNDAASSRTRPFDWFTRLRVRN